MSSTTTLSTPSAVAGNCWNKRAQNLPGVNPCWIRAREGTNWRMAKHSKQQFLYQSLNIASKIAEAVNQLLSIIFLILEGTVGGQHVLRMKQYRWAIGKTFSQLYGADGRCQHSASARSSVKI